MAAALNQSAIFDAVRAQPFGGFLKQGRVTGMTAILDACPLDLDSDSLAYCLAYCLATVFHETNRTMLPIKEYGGEAYFEKMYEP